MTRPVDLNNHDEFVRLGLYNRGRGIFKKPAADEEGMGASDFHYINLAILLLAANLLGKAQAHERPRAVK